MVRLSWLALALVLACGDDTAPMDGATDTPLTDGGGDSGAIDSGTDADVSDAGERCDDEGAMRLGPCGSCGTAQEICEGGVWITGLCLGEGACAPGSLETEDLPMCGERARLCADTCAWLDWDTTVEAGECESGEERTVRGACAGGEQQAQICSAACVWEDSGPCVSGCPGVRRTSPPDAEDVCVPAGPFIRGDDMFADAPTTTVTLSAFYIDRYPVTHRRILECRADGSCTGRIAPGLESTIVTNPAFADSPMQGLSWDDAAEFCAWDGRRLPTEAEFEKAGRGPAPRTNAWVWDSGDFECAELNVRTCPGHVEPVPLYEPVTSWPGSASYYGAELLIGGYMQWTSDWYAAGYYSDPTSLVDPQGPATGFSRVSKGWRRADPPEFQRLGRRSPGPSQPTIRCARSAE